MGHLRGVEGGGPSVVDGFQLSYRSARNTIERTTIEAAVDLPLEDVHMVRRPPKYKGQRNFPGFYYAASNARLLGYESWLERRHLTLLDQRADTAALSTQPFWLHWSDDNGKRRSHAPDVFVRHTDGTASILDVRPRDWWHRDTWRFDVMRRACEHVGWGYSLVAEPEPLLLANVEWLAGYRRSIPAFAPHREPLLAAASRRLPLGVVVRRAGGSPVTRAAAFHLIWANELQADLATARLSDATPVEAVS
jgi:hypothetical protein